ncbi:ROK family protein [Marinicrinis sediminis]|uniref:ROK family protein n=1 Tax=Marinicrinis sediminis TaxID=1652465 RepID=A0ABW5RB43_9BACL
MIRIEERIANKKAKEIYEILRKQHIVSKQQLLEQSTLTVSTLTRVLEDLHSSGWIEEVGFGDSTGGRRPILYQRTAKQCYAFGLDISRIHTKLVLCDLHYTKYDTQTWAVTTDTSPDILIREVVGRIKVMMEKHQLSHDQILGLGIGGVGPVDRHQGIMMNPIYFPAEGWEHVAITEALEEQLAFPVLLDNGANTALLAEYWCDRESRLDHMLYVHVGTGLRSSVISEGKIVYGAVDMEGAVGQMIIQTDGPPPRDPKGNYGCLDSYVSVYAIEQQARARLKQGRTSVLSQWVKRPEQVQFAHLLQALQKNDEMTKEIFVQAAVYLGIGLANLIHILHPERIILGGPLGNSSTLFFETAVESAKRHCYDHPDYQVDFTRGLLGEEALATGAAILVMNRLTQLPANPQTKEEQAML